MKAFLTVFVSIFLAEVGDKTQLATLLFASDADRAKWLVFLAAASALVASAGLAVLLGAAAERYLAALPLKLIAGLGFVAIGGLLVVEHFRGA
jgi:putative Ca2+/H+ antiporter (TMEM165/GDT1 family)